MYLKFHDQKTQTELVVYCLYFKLLFLLILNQIETHFKIKKYLFGKGHAFVEKKSKLFLRFPTPFEGKRKKSVQSECDVKLCTESFC